MFAILWSLLLLMDSSLVSLNMQKVWEMFILHAIASLVVAFMLDTDDAVRGSQLG